MQDEKNNTSKIRGFLSSTMGRVALISAAIIAVAAAFIALTPLFRKDGPSEDTTDDGTREVSQTDPDDTRFSPVTYDEETGKPEAPDFSSPYAPAYLTVFSGGKKACPRPVLMSVLGTYPEDLSDTDAYFPEDLSECPLLEYNEETFFIDHTTVVGASVVLYRVRISDQNGNTVYELVNGGDEDLSGVKSFLSGTQPGQYAESFTFVSRATDKNGDVAYTVRDYPIVLSVPELKNTTSKEKVFKLLGYLASGGYNEELWDALCACGEDAFYACVELYFEG